MFPNIKGNAKPKGVNKMYITQIELLYAIPIGLLIALGIATWLGKLNFGIALIGLLSGIGIAWAFSSYIDVAITPLSNVIWYGYAWSIYAIMVLIHIILAFLMMFVAGYNLYRTGGKAVWL